MVFTSFYTDIFNCMDENNFILIINGSLVRVNLHKQVYTEVRLEMGLCLKAL